MGHVRALVRRVSLTGSSVLITGPSGSGKERVARAIHGESARATGPFVAINCGAIPRDLLESELFGHEKGSFTGAHAAREGRFEEAHGGTLFLDEIGDMPPDMQVKLLRVLEERRVHRVGGRSAIPIDVRIVSATHRNLAEAIVDQRFREDLYYRLAVVPIALPPLRDRVADLPLLISHFLGVITDACDTVRFTPQALSVLARHAWPGNVRELRNFVERAAILHPGETLTGAQADALLLRPAAISPATGPAPTLAFSQSHIPLTTEGVDLRAILADIEARYIYQALAQSGGVVADAARLLGLQRTTLVEKMRRSA